MPDLDLTSIKARWTAATDAEWYRTAQKDVLALVREVEQCRTDRERLQRLYHMALHDGIPEGGADA